MIHLTVHQPGPNKIRVDRNSFYQARNKWRLFWSFHNDWQPFYAWLGVPNKYDASGMNDFYLAPEAANKITLLLGPHSHTALMTIKAKLL